MTKGVRAKFYVKAVEHQHSNVNGVNETHAEIKMAPCDEYSPGGGTEENKSFAKWTPCGEIRLTISNPDAVSFFELGQPFYIDFSRAEETEEAHASD